MSEFYDSDDPLFDAQESGLEVDTYPEWFIEEVRSWLPSEEEIDEDDVYWADGVGWVGIQGQMMKLPWDQVAASPMNPFEPEKTSAFKRLIASGERPIMYAPPAMLHRVSLVDVRESQEAHLRDELFASHGTTRPYTTGDEELDEFLADEESFLETYAVDDDDEQTLRADMTLRAERAISDNEGDLGKIVATLRDGNHRAFGAQLAGEDEVWIIVRMNDPERDMAFLGLRQDDFE